ncbi:MAG: DEAD/DEAH box helicase [Clostridia bacterium]|nr:DEAD/DEAH box helicase [Clostridia bacterium]
MAIDIHQSLERKTKTLEWRDMIPDEILKEAEGPKAPKMTRYLNSWRGVDTVFSGGTTAHLYSVPRSFHSTWRDASFSCSCAKFRSSQVCTHIAVMLKAWESKNGKITLREPEYEWRNRVEMVEKEKERLRREAVWEKTHDREMSVYSLMEDVPQSKGPTFFDVKTALGDVHTNEYFRTLWKESARYHEPTVTINIGRDGSKTLSGTLYSEDKLGSYSTAVNLGPKTVTMMNCSCDRPAQARGLACQHMLQLMKGMCARAASERLQDQTDRKAEMFFSSLEENTQVVEKKKEDKEPVKKNLVIAPKITLNEEGNAILTFRVGHVGKKLLILKKLQDFVSDYLSHGQFTASTKETLDFAREDFTDETSKWMEFVMRTVGEVKDVNERLNRRNYYGYGYGGDYLKVSYQMQLNGPTLDKFYDYAEGTSCDYQDMSTRNESKLFVGHTPLKVRIRSQKITDAMGNFVGVNVSGTIPVTIHGTQDEYRLSSDHLSKITQDEARAIAPFVKVAESSGFFRFQVGMNRLQEYYYRVLPSLAENPCVIVDDDAAEEAESFLPPEPKFTFMLDLTDASRLTMQGKVKYEDKIYVMEPRVNTTKGYRDVSQENRVLRVVGGFFGQYDSKAHLFFRDNMDDDAFYDFLVDGIATLEKYGTVQGTEAFRRRKIRRVPKVTVGVSVSSGIMDLSLSSEDVSPEDLLNILDSYKKKKRFYKLKSGDYVDLGESDELQEVDQLLRAMDLEPLDVIRKKAHLPLYRALYLDRMLEEHDNLATTRDRTYRAIIKNFKTIKDADFEVPSSLESIMRPYQVFGYKWLRTLEESGFGGILADEMGLGKTLQMISIFQADKENDVKLPSLVICPASLVYNWQEEIHRFAPELKVETLAGGLASRREQFARLRGGKALPASAKKAVKGALTEPAQVGDEATAPAAPVPKRRGRPPKNPNRSLPMAKKSALTVSVSEGEDLSVTKEAGGLADVYITSYALATRDAAEYDGLHFHACVLDEAQNIKNQRAAVTKAVKIIRADHRYALTGTPIENRLAELWSIFDFLMPGFLYSYDDFARIYETPIAKMKDPDATEKLKKTVSPFILRRRKMDVLKDLPAKLEEVRYARLDDEQQKLYDAQVVHMRQVIAEGSNSGEDKIKVLAELMRIRQICCDPSLVFENYKGKSAKREACMELVQSAMDGGHRMLIFSQFTSMLELLEKDLAANGIEYFKITGSTPKEKRLAMVHEFNEGDVPVFLVSLKAGGTGLNLTGADVVIHYDPWWNLAAQNQATDRAHRIGQTRQVTVYKLITKGSIEEKILELQEAKQDLAEAILEGGGESLMSLSKDELLALLS